MKRPSILRSTLLGSLGGFVLAYGLLGLADTELWRRSAASLIVVVGVVLLVFAFRSGDRRSRLIAIGAALFGIFTFAALTFIWLAFIYKWP